MKIGIITVQRAPNYGAQLQCYALFTYLKNMGHEVEVIDLLRPYHREYLPSAIYKPYIQNKQKWHQKSPFRQLKHVIKSVISSKYRAEQALKRNFEKCHQAEFLSLKRKFSMFEGLITYSQTYRSIDELYANPPQYDLYLTGSDQLWNPSQPYCIEPYFLTFVTNSGIKASYATSIGVNNLSDKIYTDYAKWLSSYSRVSVREETAVKLLSQKRKDITRHIDPTFLLPSSKWEDMAVSPDEHNYIFFFSLYKCRKAIMAADKVAKENGLKLIYRVKDYRDIIDSPGTQGIIDMSPQEWLGFIKNAEYVITDSFHGTVFSILFKQKFFAFIPENNQRGSRIRDLLKLLQLDYRILGEDLSGWSLDDINYTNVQPIINSEVDKAKAYLSVL